MEKLERKKKWKEEKKMCGVQRQGIYLHMRLFHMSGRLEPHTTFANYYQTSNYYVLALPSIALRVQLIFACCCVVYCSMHAFSSSR